MSGIYGAYEENLSKVMGDLLGRINEYNEAEKENRARSLFDHINYRIKSDESMRAKCRTRQLPETAETALGVLKDAVGLRIVCLFVDDVYANVERIRDLDCVTVVEEKDYIKQSKPNGYRSYHMILDVETVFVDVNGRLPGHYYAEIQLRTIAMDTWAQLEHEIKYKHDIANEQLLAKELKRCADDLAGCDVSMQTLRNIAQLQS